MMKSCFFAVVVGFCSCGLAFAGEDYPSSAPAVVAAYIEADGEGFGLEGETSAKVLKYTIWKDTPGWDSFTVIKAYDIGEFGYSGHSGSVQTTYRVVGQVSGPEFTVKTADEEVTFEVVKKNGKWKITGPLIGPHLTIESAIRALESGSDKDDPLGKAALKSLRALEP